MRRALLDVLDPAQLELLRQAPQLCVRGLVARAHHDLVFEQREWPPLLVHQDEQRHSFHASDEVGIDAYRSGPGANTHLSKPVQMQLAPGQHFDTVRVRADHRIDVQTQSPGTGIVAHVELRRWRRLCTLVCLAGPGLRAVLPGHCLVHCAAHLGMSVDAPGHGQAMGIEQQVFLDARPAAIVVYIVVDIDGVPVVREIEMPDLFSVGQHDVVVGGRGKGRGGHHHEAAEQGCWQDIHEGPHGGAAPTKRRKSPASACRDVVPR